MVVEFQQEGCTQDGCPRTVKS